VVFKRLHYKPSSSLRGEHNKPILRGLVSEDRPQFRKIKCCFEGTMEVLTKGEVLVYFIMIESEA
jgi:hypothetical protein